jgi:hypothetical protein
MKNLSRALAIILALLPAVAAAQTFPTVPSGTVIGRTAIGTGPAQAIPIASLIATMLNPLTVTSVNTASVIYRGSTSGTATISAQAVAGTPIIKWPTTSGTVPTTAALPVLLDAVTGAITCPGCAAGQAKLVKSGANLVLSPFNGNNLTINGSGCAIPDAGVSLAATTLTPTALYYIYATCSAGVVNALEASATAYAVSTTAGNKGIVIKSGDNTRTLVGLARVITGPAWQDTAAQRFVRSWFNDPGVALQGASITSATNSGSFVEASSTARVEFVMWAGDTIDITANGTMTDSLGANSMASAVGLDGTTAVSIEVAANVSAANARAPFSSRYSSNTPAEGYHFATLLLRTLGAGNASYNVAGGALVTGSVKRY